MPGSPLNWCLLGKEKVSWLLAEEQEVVAASVEGYCDIEDLYKRNG